MIGRHTVLFKILYLADTGVNTFSSGVKNEKEWNEGITTVFILVVAPLHLMARCEGNKKQSEQSL